MLFAMALEGKNSLKRKFRGIVMTTGHANTVSMASVTTLMPLYARRVTQLMNTKRWLRQVNYGKPVTSQFQLAQAANADEEMGVGKRERNREKKRQKQARRSKITPEALREINDNWELIYGCKCGDLLQIENEVENSVRKFSTLASCTKPKCIKFDNCVTVFRIDKENSGRLLKECKNARKVANYIPNEATLELENIV